MKVKMAQNSYRTTTQQISIQTKPKQRLGGHSVAHVILVSAQVLLVLTLGLGTLDFGLGLDNLRVVYLRFNINHAWMEIFKGR